MNNDRELLNDVLTELAKEPAIDVALLSVSVNDGAVMLTGKLSTEEEKREAGKAVQRIVGGLGIALSLNIGPASVQERDAALARAASIALEEDPGVPHGQLKIKVDGGWPSLSGDVTSQEEKLNAAENIERLSGLRGFTNDVVVKPSIDVAEVKREIEKEFRRHAAIDASNIRIEAEGETVILRGTVTSMIEKKDAMQAAFGARGVAQVKNELTVL